MSLRTFLLTCLVFFLIAMGYSIYDITRKPIDASTLVFVSKIFGEFFFNFVLTAIVPAILWAIFRFNLRAAVAPVVLWVFLFVASAYLVKVGENTDLKYRQTQPLRDEDRAEFVRSMTQRCLARVQVQPSAGGAGLSAEQAALWCDCYVGRLAKELTVAEIEDLAEHLQRGRAQDVEVSQTKLKSIGASCFEKLSAERR